MDEILRQEKKFLLSLPQMYQLNGLLSQVMQPDPHNRGDGFSIRALYFDTPAGRNLPGNSSGREAPRSLRLRACGSDLSFALLEMKQKQPPMQKKRSLRLTADDARRLIDGNCSVLLKYDHPFAAECCAVMQMHCCRPASLVEYRQLAFSVRENRVRVTLDHHLTATESRFDLFAPTLPETSITDLSLAVLAVKHSSFLPDYIRDLLQPYAGSELSLLRHPLRSATGRHITF